MRAVSEYGRRLLDATFLASATTALGLDETAFLKATPTAHTRYVTGLVDLRPAGGGPARLLDLVEGRSGKVVTDWLTDRDPTWKNRVRVAALDPFRGYDTALRTGLPGATVVLDWGHLPLAGEFHAVKLAQDCVDTVRRRVHHETLGHRGRTGDPLYAIRRVLLRGGREPHREGLPPAAGRPGGRGPRRAHRPRVDRRPAAAPRLRRSRPRHGPDPAGSLPPGLRRRRDPRTGPAAPHDPRLGDPAAGPLQHRRPPATAPPKPSTWASNASNASGSGSETHAFYRLRRLLPCGVVWHTHHTPQIRGRSPRMVS